MVGSNEDLVLDCYRLARFYHTSPEEFLCMPLSDMQMHLNRTIQLSHIMKREAERED
jgi:hypothetical protein